MASSNEGTQINQDLKEYLPLLLLVENQNKLRSSLQTSHRSSAQYRRTDTTFVAQAEDFTPLSLACELRAALHLQSGFSARATISGTGLKTAYKGLDSITSLFHTGSRAG